MLMEALLIALWAGIVGIDLFNGLTHIHRPVVTGLVVGLILGDVTTGLIIGGTLELIWMGMVPLAGAQPPNVVIGGVIGTAFGIIIGQEPTVAVGVVIPFAVAVQGLITLFFTIFSPVMHKADQYALEANYKGIERINYLGLAILFVFYAVIAFLPIFFGAEQAATYVESVPEWVLHGLSVAGGIMPAIGFAMLLKIMMKTEYIMFFIIGFVLAAYLNLPILAIALIGLAIALYDLNQNKKGSNGPPREEEITDGI
ncbi:PTS N-acetylgalactosamine transporter subunit IIC [Oceanobacillus profundus]|uniref:PTS N-acetylgalactosamine transporter subunit IIC n=1 Tax=Oceanobacillus profundus TaxID=372463 RepID=UPI0036380FF9